MVNLILYDLIRMVAGLKMNFLVKEVCACFTELFDVQSSPILVWCRRYFRIEMSYHQFTSHRLHQCLHGAVLPNNAGIIETFSDWAHMNNLSLIDVYRATLYLNCSRTFGLFSIRVTAIVYVALLFSSIFNLSWSIPAEWWSSMEGRASLQGKRKE